LSDDEPFYRPTYKPPATRTERTVGELLWEVHIDHVFWRAELFDEQAYGFDVQLFRDGEFFGSRRFANRDAAIGWASQQRADIEKRWQ
jgi:hypothetical protein